MKKVVLAMKKVVLTMKKVVLAMKKVVLAMKKVAMSSSPLSFRARAGNPVVPGRAKAEMLPPLSFRSEARNLVFLCGGCFQACLRSLPCGRDDSEEGRDDREERSC